MACGSMAVHGYDPLEGTSSTSVSCDEKKAVNPSKVKTSKMPKKKVTVDDINEEHLAVLKKEHIQLDLEIDNLLLKKREILLRIKELEARADNSC